MVTSTLDRLRSNWISQSPPWGEGLSVETRRARSGPTKLWMTVDALTIVVAATLASLFELHERTQGAQSSIQHYKIVPGQLTWSFLGLLTGYAVSLMFTSRRLNLYRPKRLHSVLQEQLLSVQACLTSALILTGSIYLLHAAYIPRGIVMSTLGLVTASLGIRRLLYRIHLYRQIQRGVGKKNALIVGTGPVAQAFRNHLENIGHLGYNFRGFVEIPPAGSLPSTPSKDVVGTLDTLSQQIRKQFVDEIFFAAPCEDEVIKDLLQQARQHNIGLRIVPDLYAGLGWNSPIEYMGQFPTIPLVHAQLLEGKLFLKRVLDLAISSFAIIVLSPLCLAIAIAIKLDSPGPIFYRSERLGKKGRIFRCIKFRTMIRDAEKRLLNIMHMNERDGVLFKVTDDPRITKVGRFLRKYSLDEFPQFLNVLFGEMSVVGPRPPLPGEVKKYKVSHLRRLDVTPGITGLWQVQARQDPSFDSYISLDTTYIENWTLWLDIKLILRTVGVVFAGTGS